MQSLTVEATAYRVEPQTDQYAEREGAGGLRSREIFDFAINGPASMSEGNA